MNKTVLTVIKNEPVPIARKLSCKTVKNHPAIELNEKKNELFSLELSSRYFWDFSSFLFFETDKKEDKSDIKIGFMIRFD